jgi:hypothetical protein
MIMEPPRHAWVSLAAWSSPGCASDPGPPSQSADLRAYYAKHTKSIYDTTQLLLRY